VLIDDQNNIILKSQCLRLILLFIVAPGISTPGPEVSERELYVQFIYLSIYPSIAINGKQIRNEYTKEN